MYILTSLIAYLTFYQPFHAISGFYQQRLNNPALCENPIVRTEWRRLPVSERRSYIDAVKCIMKKPPITSLKDVPGVTSRYEDFVATHIIQADDVHFNGKFYAYHRFLLHHWEKELALCGYVGGQPYWDWTLDSNSTEDFYHSPIFDNDHGFGGNGYYIPGNFTHPEPGLQVTSLFDVPDRTGGGCLQTGPFAELTTHIGPGHQIEKLKSHCIRRDFAPVTQRSNTSKADLSMVMQLPDYGHFDRLTEWGFHISGHYGPGGLYGELSDAYTSVSDPLFFLHHANMDRAWWSWQARNLDDREIDISGPLIAHDYDNEKGGNVTLDTIIEIGVTRKLKVKISDVMHIQKGSLCYSYDELY